MAADDMVRLRRALGFAQPGGDSPGFAAADIAAFGELARLVDAGVIDPDLALTMARPMGHLLSMFGAGQVSALSALVRLNQVAQFEQPRATMIRSHAAGDPPGDRLTGRSRS